MEQITQIRLFFLREKALSYLRHPPNPRHPRLNSFFLPYRVFEEMIRIFSEGINELNYNNPEA